MASKITLVWTILVRLASAVAVSDGDLSGSRSSSSTNIVAAFSKSSISEASISTSTLPASITLAPLIRPSSNASCANNCEYAKITFSSSTWSQWITPVIVGTAIIVINNATNQTSTKTVYNSATTQFMHNGTLETLPLQQTTQTQQISRCCNLSNVTATYPTPYFGVDAMGVGGVLQYTSAGTVSCTSFPTDRPYVLPSHTPWPKPTPQPLDTDDKYGETYTMVDAYDIPAVVLSYTDILAAFPGNSLMASIYSNCSSAPPPAPAIRVTSAGALLATTTAFVSDTPTTSAIVSTPKSPTSASISKSLTSTTIAIQNTPDTPSPQTTTPAHLQTVPAQQTTANQPQTSAAGCVDVGCFVNSGVDGGTNNSPAATTLAAPSGTTSTTASIGNTVVVVGPSSNIIIGGTTITGAQGTVTAGTSVIAVSQSAGQVAISVVGDGTTTAAGTVFSASNVAISQNSASAFVVGSQTLTPGGAAITQAGTTLSLAPSASALVVNGATILPQAKNVNTAFAVAGSTIAQNSASQFVVGSQTLMPGGAAITQSGTTYSLAPSASVLVVNGQTISGQPAATGAIITQDSASQYVLGSQTLLPGSPVTVSGTVYSISSSGTSVLLYESANGKSTQVTLPASGTLTAPVVGATASSSIPYQGAGSSLSFATANILLVIASLGSILLL